MKDPNTQDNIEQLVRENKSAFNTEEPSEKVWQGIRSRLHNNSRSIWVWKAAAVIFFLSTVGLSFLVSQKSNNHDDLIAEKALQENSILKESFTDVESFYLDKIKEKKSQIYKYEGTERVVNQHYEQDLQKLDAMYLVLKEEYKQNPSQQMVDALTLNLLVRIDILNKEIEVLEEGSEENTSDELAV